MNLREYCAKYEIKNIQLAKMLGFTTTYIAAIKTGRYKAGPKLAKAIEELSKGQVTRQDMFAMYKGAKK